MWHLSVNKTARMKTLVPLISSGIAGPLGVLHLPRLWLKASLDARGKLAPGYPVAGQGFDQMVIDGLGLERDEILAFINTNLPTYPQFEAWVRVHGTKLDVNSIMELNAAIRNYNHDDETRISILGANGIPDDDNAPKDAVNLNNLEDWKEFHDALLRDEEPLREAHLGPVQPASESMLEESVPA